MNSAVAKAAALFNSKVNASVHLRAALFHSTPVLDRRKRDLNDSRRRYYARRDRRKQKEELHRNATSYAEHLFKKEELHHNATSFAENLFKKEELHRNATSYAAENLFKKYEREFNESGPSSSGHTSWSKKQHSKGPQRGRTTNQGSQRQGRREYQFCEDDDSEFETIFRYAFGGNQQARHCFWSFIQEEDAQWSSSFGYFYNNEGRSSNRRSSNRRYQFEEDYEFDSSTKNQSSKSDRLVLGLSPSGPLDMKDVKDAYRACAMKWHPDRHQGSSKTDAEEKFKACSAAYESLREKLDVNQ